MATTFPSQILAITVELFNITGAGTWIDVSTYVRYNDKIQTHRGLTPEDTGHSSSPDWCILTFDNTDKRFSPRNVLGPYYGYIGVNTPIRVKWNAGNGNKTRFEGLVPNWNPVIPTDDIRHVRIQAFDRRQSLMVGTGRRIERSPIYTSTINSTSLVSFMPLEDDADTDLPTIINSLRVAVNGTFQWANDTDLPGAKALPTFTSSSYIIWSPAVHTYLNGWQFDFFYKLNDFPSAAYVLQRIWVNNTGSSGIAFWDIIMDTGSYRVRAFDRNGTIVVDSGPFLNSGWLLGGWMHHRLM